jgi:hypothetical protein
MGEFGFKAQAMFIYPSVNVLQIFILCMDLLTWQYIFRHQRHKLWPDQENIV